MPIAISLGVVLGGQKSAPISAPVTITMSSFIAGTGGSRAKVSLTVSYAGSNPLTAYIGTITNPSTPTKAQLKAGTGGGILEAESFDFSRPSDTDDLITLTATSEAADEIHVYVEEDGPAPQSSSVDIITGVVIDGTAPLLSSTDPVDNASDHPAADSLVATFDENIFLGTGSITLRENDGGFADLETFDVVADAGSGPGTVSISGAVLTIAPTNVLVDGREYAIRFDAGAIVDTSANPYAGISDDLVWSFDAATAAPITLPTISGDQRVSATLTADLTGLTNPVSYQWYADDVLIGGATSSTYSGQAADAQINVEVVVDEGTLKSPHVLIYDNFSESAQNSMDDAILALVDHPSMTHIAVSSGDWSAIATWDTLTVPVAGNLVLIPFGLVVTYDVAATAPRLDRIRIDGEITWALDQSTQMLVETIIVTQSGRMIIGTGFGGRLPSAYTAEIIFGDRSYGIDPNNPTDLDFSNDPRLLSRGLLAQGLFRTFGKETTAWLRTATNEAPLVSATSLVLESVPTGWAVGDTIVIPGTLWDESGGTPVNESEERVITSITTTTLTDDTMNWSGGLSNPHDHQNSAVSRTDLQPGIINATRNITFRTESDAIPARRAHYMSMHNKAVVDLWDTRFMDMGRTDKSGETGIINDSDDFAFVDESTEDVQTETLTATSNLQSRYPVHGHQLGFGQSVRPIIFGCYVENTPGWGMVHHRSDMDMQHNAIYKFVGAGMVAESANELGSWVGNLVVRVIGSNVSTSTPKNIESSRGLAGDFARTGYAYFFRGRALRVTDNMAMSVAQGFVFYHRSYTGVNTISAFFKVSRAFVDLNDIKFLEYDDAEIDFDDFPIIHFTDNEVAGVLNGFFVTKGNSEHQHDLMIHLKSFKAWACYLGGAVEYIQNYVLSDWDVVSVDPALVSLPGPGIGILLGNQVGIVSSVRQTIEGFKDGIKLHAGANADLFDGTDNPMFMIVAPTYINNDDDETYQTDGSPVNTAQDVTRIYEAEPSYITPTVTVPTIIADWDGNRSNAMGISNKQTGNKIDTVGAIPIPKTTGDGSGIASGTSMGSDCGVIIDTFGYWTNAGDDVLLVSNYYGDRLNAEVIKITHFIKATGGTGGKVNNGAYVHSANPPVRADMSPNCSKNGSVVIDPVTAATDADPSTTIVLDSAYWSPDHGTAEINVGAGTLTYTPDRNFEGVDKMFVFLGDQEGRWVTVKLTIAVT